MVKANGHINNCVAVLVNIVSNADRVSLLCKLLNLVAVFLIAVIPLFGLCSSHDCKELISVMCDVL